MWKHWRITRKWAFSTNTRSLEWRFCCLYLQINYAWQKFLSGPTRRDNKLKSGKTCHLKYVQCTKYNIWLSAEHRGCVLNELQLSCANSGWYILGYMYLPLGWGEFPLGLVVASQTPNPEVTCWFKSPAGRPVTITIQEAVNRNL